METAKQKIICDEYKTSLCTCVRQDMGKLVWSQQLPALTTWFKASVAEWEVRKSKYYKIISKPAG